MNTFGFEQPVSRDAGRRGRAGAVPERGLKYVVICEQCKGGRLWKFREERPAGEAAAAHREWSGHDVTTEKM